MVVSNPYEEDENPISRKKSSRVKKKKPTYGVGNYDKPRMIMAVYEFLKGLGLDLDDQHLLNTPERVAKAWIETFAAGYAQNPKDILNVEFTDKYDNLVIIKDVPFISHCAHHLVSFRGTAKIGYLPSGKVTGLSKLARVLECYAHRLQVQEHLTDQVADALMEHLQPEGVGVVLTAEHECMTCRGVRSTGALTVTSAIRGKLRTDTSLKQEFLNA